MMKSELSKYITNWSYGHDKPIPKKYRNKWVKIQDRGSTPKTRKRPALSYNRDRYRILLKTDPETFEYHTQSTSVDLYYNYQQTGHPDYYRIYMSTIDDRSMNLWLYKDMVTEEMHYKLLKFYQGVKKVTGCYHNYHEVANLLNFPTQDAWWLEPGGEMDHPAIHYLDFN